MRDSVKTAYLAPAGYEKQLLSEIKGCVHQCGRLFLTDAPLQKVFWAQNVWLDPFIATFESIGEAAGILRNIQRNWALYPNVEHRRAALIKDKLPYLSDKPLVFPSTPPENALGSWTLLDKHTLLASACCTSKYPNGEMLFEEQKAGPPSRAYLKLWEALTLCGQLPGPEDKCLEIGASPGGWSWVLAQLHTNAVCVDRSPLAPEVAAMPEITFKAGNAFAIAPHTYGDFDWIFSDVACYPEKLLEWVLIWLEKGSCRNFVCTLKFQGDNSYSIASKFNAIPGSRVVHLSHNKHELTWILVRGKNSR